MARKSIFIKPKQRPDLFKDLNLEPISLEDAIREAILRGFSPDGYPHPDDPKGVASTGFPKEWLENPNQVPKEWLENGKKDGKDDSKDGKDDKGKDAKEGKDGKDGKDGSDGSEGSENKEACDPDDLGHIHTFVKYGNANNVDKFIRPIM